MSWSQLPSSLGVALGVAVAAAAAMLPGPAHAAAPSASPNIIVFNIDDLGWGDIGVYGSKYSKTPNIDSFAATGTRFTQFYSAPLCSPSRAGLITGRYAARSNINSYIDNTQRNLAVDNVNSLPPSVPSMARVFRSAGYNTGHFGKWHLGGGRDVGYAQNPTPGTTVSAPRVVEYGYDKVWTQFEGLGDRIIFANVYGGNADGTTVYPGRGYNEGLDQQSAERGTNGGQDQLVYVKREFGGQYFVNRAMDFIDSSKSSGKPFYIDVWPDETHSPHDPPSVLKANYDRLYPSLPVESRRYLAVMEELDRQFGRLVQHVHDAGLDDNTMIVVTADNGAEAINAKSIGSNGQFRGGKGSVLEGGIRDPLIVRWTGKVPAGQVNTQTVMAMTDLLPSFAAIGGATLPAGKLDGENLSAALLGDSTLKRTKDLYWGMNRGIEGRYPNDGTEVVVLRRGDMKLILDADGKRPLLYNLIDDPAESKDLSAAEPGVVGALAKGVLDIRYSTPSLILPDTSKPVGRFRASDLLLADNAAVAGWGDLTDDDGVNFTVTQSDAAARPTFHTNAVNGKAAIHFDGNDALASADHLSLPHKGQGVTMFAVVTGDMTGAAARHLGQLGDKTGTAGRSVGLDVSTTAKSTENGGAGFRFDDGAALYDARLDTKFHILIWQIAEGGSYADAHFYVDGTTPDHLFTGASINAAGTVSLLGNDLQFVLGNGRSGSGLLPKNFFTGDVAEFLIYDQQLSVGQMNLVANYLSSQYALPFSYDSAFLVPGPTTAGAAVSTPLLTHSHP